MENLKTFIFIGRSGSGKGTQAELLVNHFKETGVINDQNPLFYLETGHQFREFITSTSHTGRLAKAVMDKAERQPDFLAVWLWSHMFVENIVGDEHLFLDGTPRSLNEARTLDTAMTFYSRKNICVVYLDVSREESKRRMEERSRADDKKVSDIETRLNWFDTDVLPAVKFYEDNSRYHFLKINGEQTREKIHEDIVSALPK